MTIPSIGVICAVAMDAGAALGKLCQGERDFAACLGLTPDKTHQGARRA
jgi:hypothetical protein